MTKQQWAIILVFSLSDICVFCTGGSLVVQTLSQKPAQSASVLEQTPAVARITPPPSTLVLTNTQNPFQALSPTLTLLPRTTMTPPQTSTRTPTIVPIKLTIPASTPTPRLFAPALGRVFAQVSRVIDGDTIEVSIGGNLYKIRYIGIDAPETVAPNTPVQQMGKEASAANKSLVEGKTVILEKDVSETDRYGRLLRYVFVGDLFVNAELVQRGFAKVSTYPPDVKYQSLFLQMQQEARAAGRGLWSTAIASAPQPTGVSPRPGNCDPAYPDVCIASPPPDLDCKDIPYKRFRVLGPDPHRFDAQHDGIGCEK